MSPASPNEEDTTSSRFLQLPPPPVPGAADAPAPPAPSPPSAPLASPTAHAAYPAYPGYPVAPTAPPGSDDREYRPGHNGLAIAALCCGVAVFVPFASFAAIVLGIVALGQVRRVVQRDAAWRSPASCSARCGSPAPSPSSCSP